MFIVSWHLPCLEGQAQHQREVSTERPPSDLLLKLSAKGSCLPTKRNYKIVNNVVCFDGNFTFFFQKFFSYIPYWGFQVYSRRHIEFEQWAGFLLSLRCEAVFHSTKTNNSLCWVGKFVKKGTKCLITLLTKKTSFADDLQKRTCYLHFCYYDDTLITTYVVNNVKLTSVM